MTPKERAAMQQALEALLSCEEDYIYDGENEYECDSIDWDKRNEAITALWEVLAEPQVDWQEEALRLGGLNAKHVGELRKLKAEQAEQEPVGNISLWHNHGYQNHNVEYYGTLPDGLHQLYANPVRTKDLTDDEIWEALTSIGFGTSCYEDARAVIAADREKNK